MPINSMASALHGRILCQRVKKVDNGPWHWYFYDGLKVLAEGSDTYDRTFYTLAPGAIGGIICRDGGSKYFYHCDRLGNVVGITDASGNVLRVYHNTAFGIWWSYDSDGYYQEVSDVQPYHLTTKEYDPDIGLFYFHARWYARWPGRFISRDPAGIEEEHAYAYVENRPTRDVDVTGEEARSGTCRKVRRTSMAAQFQRSARAFGHRNVLEQLESARWMFLGFTHGPRTLVLVDTCSSIKCEDGSAPIFIPIFALPTRWRYWSHRMPEQVYRTGKVQLPGLSDSCFEYLAIQNEILLLGYDITTLYFWTCPCTV